MQIECECITEKCGKTPKRVRVPISLYEKVVARGHCMVAPGHVHPTDIIVSEQDLFVIVDPTDEARRHAHGLSEVASRHTAS